VYQCSKCGAGVIVLPERKPIRVCSCQAPIIASMSSTIDGKGGVQVQKPKA
jgi:hypothetical protein